MVLVMTALSVGQKTANEKFNDATKRSEAAVQTLSSATHILPLDLMWAAAGVGVFSCKQTDLLLEHAVTCPGVISARHPRGWSMPVFYRFFAAGLGRPDKATRDADAVILIFVAQEPVDWLKMLRAVRHAQSGPMVVRSETPKVELNSARIFAYVRRKQIWAGETLKANFWKDVGIAEDNKINKPLYGFKGRDVLAGQMEKNPSPRGLPELQEFLNKQWPVRKDTEER